MSNYSDPASRYFSVTPHDSNNFTEGEVRALYVGGAGDLAAVSAAGDTVTFSAVAAGSVLPIRAVRVNSTNTTATNIVGLYA